MSKLIENLQTLMTLRGWSQAETAQRAGIEQVTLNRIMRGESKSPRDNTLSPLADLFGVSIEALRYHTMLSAQIGKADRMVQIPAYEIRGVDGDDGVDPATDIMIEVVDVEVSAGNGTIVPEYVPTRYRLPFQLSWLRRWGAKPEQIRIFPVRGASMEPVLYDGDKCVVHTGMTRVQSDCTYALIVGSELRIKRLFVLPDGQLRIVSNNADKDRYPDELVTPTPDRVLVIGRVIDKMGSGGL